MSTKTQKTDCGCTADYDVIAATDGAGSQVIVRGPGMHLLSRPLKNHVAAVELGNKVLAYGPEVYSEWFDLKVGGIGLNFLALFGGDLR